MATTDTMRRKLLFAAALLVSAGVCFITASRTVPYVPVIMMSAEPAGPPLPETCPPTEPTTIPATTAPTTEPTEPPPEEILLEDIPFYTQQGLLPTGCELVSAKMVLECYTEEEVPIQDIVDHIICTYPQMKEGVACAPHPEQAFIGSPWDPTSFGCFAPAIVDMMNELLPDGYCAVDTTGTPLTELAETYLPQGTPVLVWASINMYNLSPYRGWYLEDKNGNPTEEWYDWLVNEHCLVLIGYDADYYYFNDPYKYSAPVAYSREIVEDRNTTVGEYSAVVVQIDERE